MLSSIAFQTFLLAHIFTGSACASELIELCDFKVPASLAHANASFSVFYSIEVGPDGKAVRVTKLKNDFLADAPFVNCLNSWKLPREYGTVTVMFSWEHSKGWTQMSLSGKGVSRQLRFQSGWCVK